jgi:hypothetical protein
MELQTKVYVARHPVVISVNRSYFLCSCASRLAGGGQDGTATTVYTPVYGGMTRTPASFGDGHVMTFDFDAAFWVFNMVRYTLDPHTIGLGTALLSGLFPAFEVARIASYLSLMGLSFLRGGRADE